MEYLDITKQQLENWLGDENTRDGALNLLLDILNGAYPVHMLFNDIDSYNRE